MVRQCAVVLAASFAVGCGTPPPSFYKDVFPLTQRHCAGCHSTGGIAPFALDSYAAAKPMASAMANAVSSRRMPPWLASPSCGGPFVDSRALTDAEIATFEAWAKAGAPEGQAKDTPDGAVVTLQQLARTDSLLTMATDYEPSASLRDDYRCFVVDPQLAAGTTVTGYDIQPGSQRVVHHVILYRVKRTDAVAEDAKDATPGWQCFGGPGIPSGGALGAWAPGSSAVTYPKGTGIRLEPADVLAMQIHYNTDNAREADRTSVKLMFGTGTETSAYLLPLTANAFSIPPGAVDYRYSKTFKNTVGLPLKLYGFLPHMHTLGKTINLSSVGSGDAGCLVDIPRWDFHWQTQYFRRAPFIVDGDGGVELSCSWDNPTNRTITWGEGTSDEMCFAYVFATL